MKGSVKAFKDCLQLKELDIHYDGLTEDFFANIASFVPKLQFLRISTGKDFSDSFIDSFQSKKDIKRVIISKNYYYFGKCLSEVLLSPKAKHVIRVNENCGLIIHN